MIPYHEAKKKRRKKTCHNCGLENIEECEAFSMHKPLIPLKLPCRICQRNPVTCGWYDMFSVKWDFDENGDPAIREPTKPEQRILDVIANITIKKCLSTHA